MPALDLPFFPGNGEPPAPVLNVAGPLSRYLPPIAPGTAIAWLAHLGIAPGAWLLDPFGASPELALELARAGYRVLVTANNPILAFMLEVLAAAPRPEDFRAALAEIASARKGDERLERHIQALYTIDCPNCGRPVQARAFVWAREQPEPSACLVDCPYCHESGEKPVAGEAISRLAALSRASALHRARALERVALPDDPLRPNVEQALTCHLTRPLYALFTLINKLEGLPPSADRTRLLTALLLSASDEANTLWPYPTARSRPRQLTLPPIFRENNLWLALENAIPAWSRPAAPVPMVRLDPAAPPPLEHDGRGGIYLFHGRLKELSAALPGLPIRAVLTALPRPNQAFWTLSVLWAGWLWGREAAAPLKSVLARQRFDFNWHAGALESAFASLRPALAAGTPVCALIAEAEPAFLTAALAAASSAGFQLDGLAYRAEAASAQAHWSPLDQPTPQPQPAGRTGRLTMPIRQAAEAILAERGEPASFSVIHAGILATLANSGGLRPAPGEPLTGVLARLQALEQALFTGDDLLLRYGSHSGSLETGLWWLRTPAAGLPHPLADRVEMESVRFLQKNPGVTRSQVDQGLCAALPGLLTPPLDLVDAVLDSYAEPSGGDAVHLRLRPVDDAAARRNDLRALQTILTRLGQQLGYSVQGDRPLLWMDGSPLPAYVFFAMASTVIGQALFSAPYPAARCVLVIPGSRANLLSFKLKRDPRLREALDNGWRVVKFRHIRRLAGVAGLTRATFEAQLTSDPVEYKAIQMEMF